MTANETLKLIAKQWCNLSDLMKLAGVGRNNALVIKNTLNPAISATTTIIIILVLSLNVLCSTAPFSSISSPILKSMINTSIL